ncbi:MAG: hypothetical protein ACTSUO_07385 [Candidatus Thorarchaeota archaeon]
MAESKESSTKQYWLIVEVEDEELLELRKFIDPEIDLESLKGFDKLLHRLNNLI